MHSLHVAFDSAGQLAHREGALALQRAHQFPPAFCQSREERTGRLEVEDFALVGLRLGAFASAAQRGLPVGLQRDGEGSFRAHGALRCSTNAMKSSMSRSTVVKV